MRNNRKSRRFPGKTAALLASLVLLLTMAIGGTLAWLMHGTNALTNVFTPSEVTTKVEETITGTEKKDVYITNTGDTEAYIRAAVVITWQDAQGNIHHKKPVETGDNKDYNITYNTTDWVLKDGYWYHKAPVAAGGKTADLIETCSPIADKAPVGYFLTVEILSSGIQSKPVSVVTNQWDFVPSAS